MSATDTDSVMNATAHPRANMAHGLRYQAVPRSWRLSPERSGRTLSKTLKATSRTPRPRGKRPQPGTVDVAASMIQPKSVSVTDRSWGGAESRRPSRLPLRSRAKPMAAPGR